MKTDSSLPTQTPAASALAGNDTLNPTQPKDGQGKPIEDLNSFIQYLDKTNSELMGKVPMSLLNMMFKPENRMPVDDPKPDSRPVAAEPKTKTNSKSSPENKPHVASKRAQDKRANNKEASHEVKNDHADATERKNKKDDEKDVDPTPVVQNQDQPLAAPVTPKVEVDEKTGFEVDLKASGSNSHTKDLPKHLQAALNSLHGITLANDQTAQQDAPKEEDAAPVAQPLSPELKHLQAHLQDTQEGKKLEESLKHLDQHPDAGNSPKAVLNVSSLKVTKVVESTNLVAQTQEKNAEATPEGGKNVSVANLNVASNSLKSVIPPSVVLSLQAALEAATKGDVGIKDALKSYMREASTSVSASEAVEVGGSAGTKQSTGSTGRAPATTPVRMAQLIDRVQKAIDAQLPPNPRQISFQVDPKSLGNVQVNMHWSAEGWNVNWSVTKNEVREWLQQQLPALQQQSQEGLPIIWHPPQMQSPGWNFSQQQGQTAGRGQDPDSFLKEDDDDVEGIPPASNEYWA